MHTRKLYALDIEGFKQGIFDMENAFESKDYQMHLQRIKDLEEELEIKRLI